MAIDYSKLREIRTKMGLSQQEMAAKLGRENLPVPFQSNRGRFHFLLDYTVVLPMRKKGQYIRIVRAGVVILAVCDNRPLTSLQ